jgi:integrase/recombinase XerD
LPRCNIGDVLDADGRVKAEIRLDAVQTKGKHARVVFVSDKLRKEIAGYVKQLNKPDTPLFATQKRERFSPNTLCQTMNTIYRHASIAGATSHSGRRSFITTLASKGVGVRVLVTLPIRKYLGVTSRPKSGRPRS